MKVFKIREAGLKEIKKRALVRTIPLAIIAVVIGMVFSFYTHIKTDIFKVLPIIIPLSMVVIVIGINKGLKNQIAILKSYKLTITDNLISREQFNTPDISMYYNEITAITKNKNGSITIKGTGTLDIIGVPSQVEDYDKLEQALQDIKPIKVQESLPLIQRYKYLFLLLMFGLMSGVLVANNKMVVGISGIVLSAFLIWTYLQVRVSKNIDANTKKSFRWNLLMIAAVLLVTLGKLLEVEALYKR